MSKLKDFNKRVVPRRTQNFSKIEPKEVSFYLLIDLLQLMNKNMTIDKSKIDKLSKSNNSKKASPKNKSKKPKRARSAGLQLQHP